MTLTMSELAGIGALTSAAGHLDRYVACLKKRGLDDAFYLQDPRQEIVTEAHRKGDGCYEYVSQAVYEYVKQNVVTHLEASRPSDGSVQAMWAAWRAGRGYRLGDVTVSASALRDIIRDAIDQAEMDAQQKAEAGVGRVRSVSGTSPLTSGANEWKRSVEAQEAAVRAGTVRRTRIADSEVISPEVQEQRRRAAAEAARRQRERTGELYSCPPSVPLDVCRSLYGEKRGGVNKVLVGGLALLGVTLLAVAVRRRS